jgi:hypothetical protein
MLHTRAQALNVCALCFRKSYVYPLIWYKAIGRMALLSCREEKEHKLRKAAVKSKPITNWAATEQERAATA